MKARDPKELVPGEPELIWQLADSYGSIGVAFEDIGRGLRSIDDGGWQGAAAAAFHDSFDWQPRRFLEAADAFVTAAVALDTYASALNWAQRQAAEAIAMARDDTPALREEPTLTVTQQVELAGVVTTGTDTPDLPREARESPRAAVGDVLHRALDQVSRVGREAAKKIRAASRLAPESRRVWQAVRTVAPPAPRLTVLATITKGHAVPDVATTVRQHLDHDTLRDNPGTWMAGMARTRLRRLGLNQLSPRLKQHLFEGLAKKRKRGVGYREVGYHHREGGVDAGQIRVVKIVAGPDANGVYRARIAGPKTAGSSEVRTNTFFPDSWTRDDVLRAVRLAFHNRSHCADRKWRGQAFGLTIEGYVEVTDPPMNARSARLYHVVTAYPIYDGGSRAKGR
jgi:hypothetical protein